jgi:hypothetical protein
MVSKITLEVDKEFLETYRNYKIDSVLDNDKIPETVYIALGEFIEKSTYNLNRLFEEVSDNDVESLALNFEDYSVKKHYSVSALDGLDDLFSIE